MSWLLALAVLAALASMTEALLRRAVGGRITALLRSAVDTDDPTVTLSPGRLGPSLARGRLDGAVLQMPRLRLGDLVVHDVTVRLVGIRVDRRLVITAGHGTLDGHLTGPDVRRRTGMPGRVRLSDGRASVRLGPTSVGVRPVVDANRIRLIPTPFALILPPLPPGVRLVSVDTADDALHLHAVIELPPLLYRHAPT